MRHRTVIIGTNKYLIRFISDVLFLVIVVAFALLANDLDFCFVLVLLSSGSCHSP
jgi:hypothetical protein